MNKNLLKNNIFSISLLDNHAKYKDRWVGLLETRQLLFFALCLINPQSRKLCHFIDYCTQNTQTTLISPFPFQMIMASYALEFGCIWCIAFLLLLLFLKHRSKLIQLQASSMKARHQVYINNSLQIRQNRIVPYLISGNCL